MAFLQNRVGGELRKGCRPLLWSLRVVGCILTIGCSVGSKPLPPMDESELAWSVQIEAVRRGIDDQITCDRTSVTDAMLQELTGLTPLKTLRLRAETNVITDAGVSQLKGLGLTHLWLRGAHLTDAGLAAICEIASLEILNLPQADFTDEGLEHLKRLPRLMQLRFASPRVTDNGAMRLCELPSLTRLHLIDIPITDAGLTQLAAMKQLESLYLDGAKITDAGLDALFAARPDLHVHINQQHHDHDPHQHPHE